ncbi:MAG TPA: hypothetical protein VFC56_13850 [Stellaceae bacterium]|nr:hypothetical protein [Stellaceae bacterium]
MAKVRARRVGWSILSCALVSAALLLGGCVNYANSEFATNQDVDLRFGQADDSSITAHVPRGTPVERLGWVGGECECWLVTTPNGTGWVYTRYLDLHLADSQPE